MSRDKFYGRAYNMGVKWQVMAHYSYAGGLTQCANCGWHNLVDLEIDHINENGREHRLQYCNGAHSFYGVLVRMGFPDDWELQVLCRKCHDAKPHPKRKSTLSRITVSIEFDSDHSFLEAQERELWEVSA